MLRKLSSQVSAERVQPHCHAHVRSSLQSLPLLLQETKMPQNGAAEPLYRNRRAMERSKKTTNLLTFDISQYARFALAYTNGTGGWKAQLQLPSWISTSVYEFISAPAIAGWTYSYRVYSIIPDDSEVIRKIKCGDLVGIQQMFSSRDASPFDRTTDGTSLLHVRMDYSLSYGQIFTFFFLSTQRYINSTKYANYYFNLVFGHYWTIVCKKRQFPFLHVVSGVWLILA